MKLADLFLDYFNNFLTVDRFAEYYGLEPRVASRVIQWGRKLHEKRAERVK
jgi:hypothetical protein